ncbi:MAG: PEP-CTERM sorting domain-containing protein [Cyanobacteria bacterium P01_H01_bin.150]
MMKFKELGLACASLAISLVGMVISSSSAQATSFFGEDIQNFAGPSSANRTEDSPDLAVLTNSYNTEQDFLDALASRPVGTINFEPSEGFTKLNDKNNPLNYKYGLTKADGSTVTMDISDPNSGPNWLSTTVQRTDGRSNGKNSNVAGGRYGVSDAGLTAQQRSSNQFLNTNAGKDSNLEFNFSQAVSAFGFYGTDFERGALMGVEYTLVDGNTKYINLDLSNKDDFDESIRGTAFYSGYMTESGQDYFTKVRFDIKDAKAGTNDIVGFDRMTFAATPMKKFVKQKVPEPTTGVLAFGTVVSGAAFKRRKK